MADKFQLKALIWAQDKLSPVVRRANVNLKLMMRSMRRLDLKGLGLQARMFGAHLSAAGRQFAGLGASIAAVGATIGVTFVGLKNTVAARAEALTGLGKLKDQLGMSAEALQQWQYVASQTNVPLDQFNLSMGFMNKNMGALKAGTGGMAASLKKISPALAAQLRSAKDGGEALGIMIAALRQVPDANKRAYLATQFFGKSGQVMVNLATQSAESIEELKKRAIEMGVVSDSAIDDARKMQRTVVDFDRQWAILKGQFATQMIPVMQPLLEQLTGFMAGNRGKLAGMVKQVVEPISRLLSSIDFDQLATSFGVLVDVLTGVINLFGGLGNIMTIFFAVKAVQVVKAVWGVAKAFQGLLGALGMGPWGMAIAAILVGIYLLITHWDKVKAAFKAAWDFIQARMGEIGAFFGQVYDGIINKWNGLIDFFKGLWEGVKKIFRESIETISNFGLDGFNTGAAESLVKRQANAQAAHNAKVGGSIDVNFANAPSNMLVSRVRSTGGPSIRANVGRRAGGSL